MLRALIALLSIIIYMIIWLPVLLVTTIIRSKNPQKAAKIAHKWADPYLRILLYISGSKVEIRGIENIPKDEPVLFVSNHRSIFDIVAACGYTPKLTSYRKNRSFQNPSVFPVDERDRCDFPGPQQSEEGTEKHPSCDRPREARKLGLGLSGRNPE